VNVAAEFNCIYNDGLLFVMLLLSFCVSSIFNKRTMSEFGQTRNCYLNSNTF